MKHVSPVKLKILIQRKLFSQLLNEIILILNVLTLDFVRCNKILRNVLMSIFDCSRKFLREVFRTFT
jgi:hypothetical protein